MDTTAPEDVSAEMKMLLAEYNSIESKAFENLLDFHFRVPYQGTNKQ